MIIRIVIILTGIIGLLAFQVAYPSLAPEQQAVHNPTAVEWFQSLPAWWPDKAEVLAIITLPFWLTFAFNLPLVASLRRHLKWSDRKCFLYAGATSAILGTIMTTFLMEPINSGLGYEVFKWYAPIGALVITPFGNHFAFRVLVGILVGLHTISNHVPEQKMYFWLAEPLTIITSGLYRTLTGKDIEFRG